MSISMSASAVAILVGSMFTSIGVGVTIGVFLQAETDRADFNAEVSRRIKAESELAIRGAMPNIPPLPAPNMPQIKVLEIKQPKF